MDRQLWEALIEIFVETTALFLPTCKYYRSKPNLSENAIRSLLLRRQQYFDFGLKSIRQIDTLHTLQAKGLIRIENRLGCNFVKLTDRGDDWCRWQAPGPLFHESFIYVDRIKFLLENRVCCGDIVLARDIAHREI